MGIVTFKWAPLGRGTRLRMLIDVFNQDGRKMRIVLAGPFASDNQLQNA